MLAKPLHILLLSFLMLPFCLYSQHADSTDSRLNEALISQLESIVEEMEYEVDFTELVESYIYFSENKININEAELDELIRLYLITPFHLESINKHRKEFGNILSIYELPLIEGFDAQTIAIITPLLRFDVPEQTQKLKLNQVAKYARHQLLLRFEDVLEQREGYAPMEDSLRWQKPNSRYLGNSHKYYARYAFNYRNKIKAGVTMEKDPGELFLTKHLDDSIKSLLGSYARPGFDFYSAHLFVKDIGIVKAAVIGDYHLAFGQGLTMWSGLSFGKSTDPLSVMRYGQGIKANTSVNEFLFLRGAAASFGWKRFGFTAFFSSKMIDASIPADDSLSQEEYIISSIDESGFHRTPNELLKKGNISQQLIGGRITYRTNKLELGYTLHETKLGATLMPRQQLYNQFRFQGDQLVNQGIDYRWVLSRIIFFGEISRSDNGGLAALTGIMAQPTGFVTISMAARNYQKEYQNLFGSGFSEGSLANNEKGIYIGVTAALAAGWKLTAFADYFVFPWLRFATDAPSYGYDYFAQLDHRINRNADVYLRFRSKTKLTNDKNPWNNIDFLIPYTKNSYRFHLNYRLGPSWILKNRIEAISYQKSEQNPSMGYIIYQDVLYRPHAGFYELSFRYSLFQSEDYDSRLYTYENDVLYAFSIPAFYGKGSRVYLMLKLKAHRKLDFWARIGRTWYADRYSIGTGLETIEGQSRTDVKLQLRWKF